jgi:hypothetical protein
MNIKLRAGLRTVKQLLSVVVAIGTVVALFTYVPVDILAIALVVFSLVGFLYIVYEINLSKLQDDEEVRQGKARQAEFQRGLDTLPKI